ncbi:hypothetical protein [Aquimarina algiphila]|uniref:Uncharacterized protein n=1 Tax=Aquimarina algiphila TaxID=2047982 RepID=A0A554VIG2_9FLAO|nr:hypothetical protein [Aquimarina algiphila]TSE07412.1 hypothetical protein FOF46_15970 [Aquimarina algiphila]
MKAKTNWSSQFSKDPEDSFIKYIRQLNDEGCFDITILSDFIKEEDDDEAFKILLRGFKKEHKAKEIHSPELKKGYPWPKIRKSPSFIMEIAELIAEQKYIKKLREKLSAITQPLNYDHMKNTKKNNRQHLMIFMLLLAISITICAVTLNYTDSADTQITIEYNVGEIIAAILAGAGISSAGIAYAAKTIKDMNKEE